MTRACTGAPSVNRILFVVMTRSGTPFSTRNGIGVVFGLSVECSWAHTATVSPQTIATAFAIAEFTTISLETFSLTPPFLKATG
jgi:hypothetical protein